MDIFSLAFLILLGVSFVLYYFVGFLNKKFKKIIPQWSILLIASLVFYGFTNYVYLIYLGASSLISYICALLTQYKLFDKKPKENGQSYIYI